MGLNLKKVRNLILATVGVSVIEAFLSFLDDESLAGIKSMGLPFFIGVTIAFWAFIAFLAFKVAKGRNWARIVYLIVSILAFLAVVPNIVALKFPLIIPQVIIIMMNCYICILLFGDLKSAFKNTHNRS